MPQPEQKSPREWLLLVMWRQKFLIGATVLACLIAALVYLQVKTPLYRSAARLVVTPAAAITPGGEGGAHYNSEKFLFTQMELLVSPSVLQLVPLQKEVVAAQVFKGKGT